MTKLPILIIALAAFAAASLNAKANIEQWPAVIHAKLFIASHEPVSLGKAKVIIDTKTGNAYFSLGVKTFEIEQNKKNECLFDRYEIAKDMDTRNRKLIGSTNYHRLTGFYEIESSGIDTYQNIIYFLSDKRKWPFGPLMEGEMRFVMRAMNHMLSICQPDPEPIY